MNAQVASLQSQVVVLEQALALAKLSPPMGGGGDGHAQSVPSSSSSSSIPVAAGGAAGVGGGGVGVEGLQEELTKMTSLYQQAHARMTALEGERVRLEKEAKDMSRSLAESIQMHSPQGHSHSSSTQRQRTTTGGSVPFFHIYINYI